ncbi:hypothetical protein B9479_003303 [Cryptococcus floricola]|uniref:Uncharacterized protein n=1 Tax=Cryptococcus floricola TaxID=2591691 RepID=A0A5D3B172_9TREE|nr:hypothetical protein B9479_003303 [Cryptococcus floricola]
MLFFEVSGVSLTNLEDEHPVITTILGQGDGSRFRRRPWPKAFVRTPSGGALPVSFHSLGALPDTAILTCGFALEGYLMSGDSKAGLEWVTEIVIIEGLLEEKVSVGTGPKTPPKRKADVDMDVLLGLSSGKKGELDMLPGGNEGEADSTYDVAAAVAMDSAPNTPTVIARPSSVPSTATSLPVSRPALPRRPLGWPSTSPMPPATGSTASRTPRTPPSSPGTPFVLRRSTTSVPASAVIASSIGRAFAWRGANQELRSIHDGTRWRDMPAGNTRDIVNGKVVMNPVDEVVGGKKLIELEYGLFLAINCDW